MYKYVYLVCVAWHNVNANTHSHKTQTKHCLTKLSLILKVHSFSNSRQYIVNMLMAVAAILGTDQTI